jgi:hypothetical protein
VHTYGLLLACSQIWWQGTLLVSSAWICTGGAQEASEGIINLLEDKAAVLELLPYYLYDGEYQLCFSAHVFD